MEDVASKVRDILEEHLGVGRDKLTDDAKLIEDLGADSLDTVELCMAFEEDFGVEIPDDDAEKVKTVGDAVKAVQSLVAARA